MASRYSRANDSQTLLGIETLYPHGVGINYRVPMTAKPS